MTRLIAVQASFPFLPFGPYLIGMSTGDLAHLELLAEIDALAKRLEDWSRSRPPWRPAETCRAIIDRLAGRLNSLRIRLESPLIVATLGGTGTGKSSLINALAGAELVRSGREPADDDPPGTALPPGPDARDPGHGCPRNRSGPTGPSRRWRTWFSSIAPTPIRPMPPDRCRVDTTLARLRRILPQCDVLIVTTTQQKYRSAARGRGACRRRPGSAAGLRADPCRPGRRCSRRLAARVGTRGIRPVTSFSSIRLPPWPTPGRAVRRRGSLPPWSICSRGSLPGRRPPGFAAPTFSTWPPRRWKAAAAAWTKPWPPSKACGRPSTSSAASCRRRWRGRSAANCFPRGGRGRIACLGQVASRWGFSPFSLVLRIYQGIGGLASGALLYRARTPAQLALWGVVEGARTWQKHRRNRQLQQRPGQAAADGFDATQLRRAAVVLEGYAAEAGLPKASASVATLEAEAEAASLNFAARLSQDLDALIAQQAQRHTGWFTRWRYEILLAGHAGLPAFPAGKELLLRFLVVGLARCGAWSRISPRPSGSCSGVSCCSGCSRGACAADSSRPSTAWPRLDRVRGRLRRLRGVGRRLPPGPGVPAGSGVAPRRRGAFAGERVGEGDKNRPPGKVLRAIAAPYRRCFESRAHCRRESRS